MASALVAITASRLPAERVKGSRWDVCATNDTYLSALRAVGLRPVLVAVGEDTGSGADLMAPFAGLVLPGGGDVDPSCYGSGAHPRVSGVDRDRDDLELALLAAARAAGAPVLAICRGLQVVNVAFGGDLVQHVPDLGGEVVHAGRSGEEPPAHGVDVEPGSRLATAVDGLHFEGAASLHHQAAGRVGPGLVVVGRSSDGLVEALEPPAEDPWWMLAVQWHPEVTAEVDATQRRLFAAFAGAVAVSFDRAP